MAIRKRSLKNLKDNGLNEDDIRVVKRMEKKAEEAEERLERLENGEEEANLKEFMRAKKDAESLKKDYLYVGVDPRDIPREELLEMVKTPYVFDNVEVTYRNRIRNPMTAIRAFCVICMGGQPSQVRKCTATRCPLWGLRLGKNNYSPRRGGNPNGAEALKKWREGLQEEEYDEDTEDDNEDDDEEVIIEEN